MIVRLFPGCSKTLADGHLAYGSWADEMEDLPMPCTFDLSAQRAR